VAANPYGQYGAGCVPITTGQLGFQVQGIQPGSMSLSFGRLGGNMGNQMQQSSGNVIMTGAGVGMNGMGMMYAGSSNYSGSRIMVSLTNGLTPGVAAVPTTGVVPGGIPGAYPYSGGVTTAMGSIYLSSTDLQMAGIYNTMGVPSVGGMIPGQYPGAYPGAYPGTYPGVGAPGMNTAMSTCASSVGAVGNLDISDRTGHSYYGGAVWVYLNGGSTFIKFTI